MVKLIINCIKEKYLKVFGEVGQVKLTVIHNLKVAGSSPASATNAVADTVDQKSVSP